MGMIISDSVTSENTYFWGKRTSTIDWCEENYAKSPYIAEFWNTATNLVFMMLSLSGMICAVRSGHGKRVFACYMGSGFIAIGSLMFHATLKYSTQLLDELPMLYTTAIGSYALIEINREIRYGWKLPAGIFLINLAVTVAYMWVVNPIFHQVVFAAFVLTCFGTCYKLMDKVYDKKLKHKLVQMLSRSALMFIAGFGVWNLDNIFCHQLRTYRANNIKFPFDVIFQLHGWWHILTGYACHYAFTCIVRLRTALWNETEKYKVEYNNFAVPNVVFNYDKAKEF